MVDWPTAQRVARFAARSDHIANPGVDLAALAVEIEPPVSSYARLTPTEPVPRPELVSREGWARVNLDAMANVIEPVEQRLGERFAAAGRLAGPLRSAAGLALAAELGLVTGYLSQRVLGQYELSLLAGAARPRLLFVTSNVVGAAAALGVDRNAFVRWVAIHEMTHALQFGAVPWLREHIGGLLREYLASLDLRLDGDGDPGSDGPGDVEGGDGSGDRDGLGRAAANLFDRLRAADLPDPSDLAQRFREGGLAGLVQTEDQRHLMERMQAAMAVVEGHAEHVMDALAPQLVPQHEGLREAMDRRRASRSAPERVLMRLLGMEMKLRQYKLGKRFCDVVVAQRGIDAFNAVWTGPEQLPTLAEVERPETWLARRDQDPPRLAAG